jgi:hypothetical protein
MTIGKSAGALAASALMLFSQACDSRPSNSSQRDRVGSQEPVRVDPVPPPQESKSPRPAEVAPPVAAPKTSAPAAPAKPRPPRESVPAESPTTKPSGVTQAEQAKNESTPPRENTPPKESAPTPVAAATLDLDSLEKRLRETKAIGVFTKLSLKNQVDDLLQEFREFHKSHDRSMLTRLRQAYDLLLLKVLSLLQDDDPVLARDISSSRETLWRILTDPDKFKDL